MPVARCVRYSTLNSMSKVTGWIVRTLIRWHTLFTMAILQSVPVHNHDLLLAQQAEQVSRGVIQCELLRVGPPQVETTALTITETITSM